MQKDKVQAKYYWLRRFRFARKKIGGAWVKTAFRGWIQFDLYLRYKAYGFDPKVLLSEENGIIKWATQNKN